MYLPLPWQTSWQNIIADILSEKYMTELREQLSQKKETLPESSQIFRPFDLTNIWNLKCVIIGDEPYPKAYLQNGLAYAVPHVTERNIWPGSIRMIERALKVDLNQKLKSPDLVNWANQGVLLLNNVLTVSENAPRSHEGLGWERFTLQIIDEILACHRPVIWLLWGVRSENILSHLRKSNCESLGHEIVADFHPSLTKVAEGFLWHKPFTKVNAFCDKMNYMRVRWDA